MDMQSITPDNVLKAIDECRRLGPDEFIEQYGFGEPRSRYLIYEGRSYGAKAIVGVAHGFAQPALGPLTAGDLRYRTNHARSTLERLKFKVTDGKSDHTVAPETADGSGSFNPTIVVDTRVRNVRAIYQRRGQQQFRDALLAAYNNRCVVTGCPVRDVLEAAHIFPYRGHATNQVNNGLLFRADIHTLFDCGLMGIDPESMAVLVAKELNDSEYEHLRDHRIRSPQKLDQQPSVKALRAHMKRFGW